MKRMVVGLSVCLSLSLNVAAQKERSDREYDGLVEPVRIVKVETAKVEEKSGKVEAKDRTLQQSSTYDAKGNLIERRDRDHQSLGLDRHVFSYDAGGNRSEKHYLTGMPSTAISPSGRVLSTDGSIEVKRLARRT